jgi:hypothetical protein
VDVQFIPAKWLPRIVPNETLHAASAARLERSDGLIELMGACLVMTLFLVLALFG